MKIDQCPVYVCEVCGKKSLSHSIINACEKTHKNFDELPSWGKIFVLNYGWAEYKKALKRLKDTKNSVYIWPDPCNSEYNIHLRFLWDYPFPLASFYKEKDAIDFCKEMGWKYDW